MPTTLNTDERTTLEAMLASLEFTHNCADQVSNDDWLVRATHTGSEIPDRFDAGIVILPRNPFRLPTAGVGVEVERTDAIGVVFSGRTNALGQAWFRGLEPGTYRARLVTQLARRDAPLSGLVPPDPDFGAVRPLALAADSASEIVVCETGDPRFDVIIRTVGTEAKVQIETRAAEPANARIFFRIGVHEVSVQLVHGRAEKTLEFPLPDRFDGWLDDFRIES